MAMPEPDITGYAQAAGAYWEAGWRGILPLRRGAKVAPPKGFTGYAGVDPSYPDVLQWAEEYPDGNVCLRLPDDVIGIDVDAYGAKTGAAALAEAEKRWGKLEPTARSTSRDDDQVSGIRLYRIPPGTLLEDMITFADLSIGDIEIIQRHHRYVVCWPSIHPEGRGYKWVNDGYIPGIPLIDTLPLLPQPWLQALILTPRSPILNGEYYDVRTALTNGEASRNVSARLAQAMKELNLPGQSRHDTTCRHVMALLRLGKQGEPGIDKTLTLLREVFVSTVTADGSRTPDEARAEFNRMVTNTNAARELAQPGLTDWMRAIVTGSEREYPPVEANLKSDSVSETDPAHDYFQQAVAQEALKLRIRDEAKALWSRQRAALMGQQPPAMVSMEDFLAVPDPEVNFRITDLLPAGGRVMLAAQYKAGKTSLIANLLRSLVDGDPFLGKFNVEPLKRVLLIDTELDEDMLRRWLRVQGIQEKNAINLISLRGRLSTFNIVDDRTRAQWAKLIGGAQFVILDCLRPCLDAIGLSEDKEAGVFLTAFDALCRECGAPEALVVHHMGHTEERSRGDSRLLDWPDVLWKIVRDTNDDGDNIESGDRFFSAVGRDVNVAESQLSWEPFTRALSVCGGNRIDKKARNAILDIVDIMQDPAYGTEGMSKNQLVNRLKTYGHGRNVARAAVVSAVTDGTLYTLDGPRGAALHHLNPSRK